ncbi:MAG: DUF427 domain-containing protein [Actinomycetota bacterium]
MSDDVTLVRGAIHNPAEPRHFMRIVPVDRTVTATVDGVEVARSDRAMKVKEVGRDVYDPVVYVPRDDVDLARLERTDRTTHCPLKGDTEYFDLLLDDGRIEHGAWSYVTTFDFAAELAGLVAFDTADVDVVEHRIG